MVDPPTTRTVSTPLTPCHGLTQAHPISPVETPAPVASALSTSMAAHSIQLRPRDGEAVAATAEVVRYGPGDRTSRAGLIAGCGIALGAMSIVVPGVHLISTWLLPLLGLGIAAYVYRIEAKVGPIAGPCPSCGATMNIEAPGSVADEAVWVRCDQLSPPDGAAAPRSGLTMDLDAIRTLDRSLVKAARRIRVLGTLSWPASVEAPFLEAWRAGRPILPEPPPPQTGDLSEVATALRRVVGAADPTHPATAFLGRTAEGYLRAVQLLQSAGTSAFTEASIALYGSPTEPVVPGAPTPLEEARHLIAAADRLECDQAEGSVAAPEAAVRLAELAAPHFADPLPIHLDPDLGSLAAAGSRRVRLRDGVRYTDAQIHQLLHHEALVHAATKRNGQQQPILSSLGLSSPRTMAVQEGLATLAELVTDSMDVARLRRIALRVEAVHAALQGADFVEVFTLLLEAGQPELEAYRSTMRVFRGGDVRGGIAFTKDVVYLGGLREVHTFLLAALREQRPSLVAGLFLGRLTLGDVLGLEPLLQHGIVAPAAVIPPWVARRGHLAANLTWREFGRRVPLEQIRLADFAEG